MIERPNMVELKRLYREKKNLMKYLRDSCGSRINSPGAILAAYDLQSGSYIASLSNAEHRIKCEAYAGEIAEILGVLDPTSMLEAGVGEATTLCAVLRGLEANGKKPEVVAGFDISWSRLNCARSYLPKQGFGGVHLAVGDMFKAPYVEGAFDLVYTAHAIEPNHGRERGILRELARISHRWVVLFEPSYELGGGATRSRIEEHGYCRGLPELAEKEGLVLREHRLIHHPVRADNATAVLILEKREQVKVAGGLFGCPGCGRKLESVKGHWFCEACSLVYPVVGSIPCLLWDHGILATHFCDPE